jgi:PKD repeat protein
MFIIVIQTASPANKTINETTDSINKIILIETELINLTAQAHDPDEDPIGYSFTKPLDEYGNWQTTYGDAGEHKVIITASDGDLSTSEEILIIVKKKEEIPTIDSIFPKKTELTINEGSQILFKVIASDINKDELIYAWELDGEKISEQNTLLYQTDYFDAGLHNLALELSDGTHTLTKEWEISVKNKDRPPIFAPIKSAYMRENEEVILNLGISDPDNDSLEIWAENLPEGASLSDQEFSWQPNYDAVKKDTIITQVLHKLNLLYKRFKINFFVKSDDITKKRSLKIWVKDINRPPQLDYIPPMEVNEGEAFTIEPSAIDLDGDKISYSFSGWINKKSHTTGYEDAGKYTVRVTVSDGFLTDAKDVEIIVKDVNRAPVLDLKSEDIHENERLSLAINAIDFDGDFVNISAIGLPPSAKIKDNVLEWTPDYNFVKEETKDITIKLKADDGKIQSENDLILVVHNKNRAPEIINVTPSDDIPIFKNTKVKFKIVVEDPDNDNLQYLWEFGFLEKYNATNTHLRGFTKTGKKKIKVTITDGKDSVSHTWNINVVEKVVKKSETVKKVEDQLNLKPKTAKPETGSSNKRFKTYKIEG